MTIVRMMITVLMTLFSFVCAQDHIVFEATYAVQWKGWQCGEMKSTLSKIGPNEYQYTQDLESSLFFYPFNQKETSVFSIKNNELHSKIYKISRYGIQGKSYTIKFENGSAYVEIDDTEYPITLQNDLVYDKLITQLVLIRDVATHPVAGTRVIAFVDPSGVHLRPYHLSKNEINYKLKSDYGNKTSVFILDPHLKYIPIKFEQYRKGDLFLTGELINSAFGDEWDNFLNETKNHHSLQEKKD